MNCSPIGRRPVKGPTFNELNKWLSDLHCDSALEIRIKFRAFKASNCFQAGRDTCSSHFWYRQIRIVFNLDNSTAISGRVNYAAATTTSAEALDKNLHQEFYSVVLYSGVQYRTYVYILTLSQTWFYFSAQQQREHSDPLWLRATVVVVVILDFLHQLFTSHWMYDYCVTNFGNSAALDVLPCQLNQERREWHIQRGATFLVVLTALRLNQNISFYVWRVWKLSNNVIIAGAIWSLSLAQFGAFLYYVARVFGVPNASDLSLVLGNYAILVNAIGATCDIVIACAMVFYLRQSRTSIKRTNHLLRSITIFTVTTGIVSRFPPIPSVCAIMVLSMAAAYPGTNIELTFYFMLTRRTLIVYANSFLATLNVRDHLRELGHGGIITTSNFVQTRTTATVHRTVSHEMDDFPRQKGTQNILNISHVR
ncbi:hypothetical protein EV359DRAFT_62706 [Lentinula novae-zelandiae]|nr:hypothetical protein EV359DRAFT_62706 [Lentinula novae-zelandiae]